MSDPRPTFRTAMTILYISFAVNGLASIVTLALMRYMYKQGRLKFNLYTKCVLQMTFYQLLYECSVPFYFEVIPATKNTALRVVDYFFALMAGIGSSTWAFMLLLGALYAVHYGRQPTGKEQLVACVVCNVFCVGYAVPCGMYMHYTIQDPTHGFTWFELRRGYDMIRLALIVLSTAVMLRLYYVMLQTSAKGQRAHHPLYHLLKKIVAYPILLSVARFGATTYKQIYNSGPEKFPENAGTMQTFWLYAYVLLIAIVGLGFLIIFVSVTAGAKRALIQMLRLECIFTLPPEIATAWAPDCGSARESSVSRVEMSVSDRPQLQSVRLTRTAEEERQRLVDMDEHDLAVEMIRFSTVGLGGMSGKEEDGDGERERQVPFGSSTDMHEM